MIKLSPRRGGDVPAYYRLFLKIDLKSAPPSNKFFAIIVLPHSTRTLFVPIVYPFQHGSFVPLSVLVIVIVPNYLGIPRSDYRSVGNFESKLTNALRENLAWPESLL